MGLLQQAEKPSVTAAQEREESPEQVAWY